MEKTSVEKIKTDDLSRASYYIRAADQYRETINDAQDFESTSVELEDEDWDLFQRKERAFYQKAMDILRDSPKKSRDYFLQILNCFSRFFEEYEQEYPDCHDITLEIRDDMLWEPLDESGDYAAIFDAIAEGLDPGKPIYEYFILLIQFILENAHHADFPHGQLHAALENYPSEKEGFAALLSRMGKRRENAIGSISSSTSSWFYHPSPPAAPPSLPPTLTTTTTTTTTTDRRFIK